MLFLENAGSQRVLIIFGEHRHGFLEDDRSVIKVFIDEVHRAAGNRHAVVEGLFLCVKSWEGGQKRGVDVEDSIRELLHEPGR